tara:strand:+ start:92 stop:508 length:417 start_codon:yes stop_codon:yes gene_type:complete
MRIIKIILFLVLIDSNLHATTTFYNDGLILFEKKEFDKAKFKFEQDIVHNPKNENSYLYLSKIFKELKKKDLEEKNLNTVILLNPLNEEATFNLAKLKLEESDYKGSNNLVNKLLTFCKNYCNQSKELKIEIEKSLKK